MYKIREAKIEDYHSFLILYREYMKENKEQHSPELGKETYENIINSSAYELYVIENNKEFQAFTLFYKKKHQYLLQAVKEVLFIEALFVRKSEEKKGLKLYLYEKIERYAKRNGIKEIETLLPVAEQEKIAHYDERFKLKAEYAVLISHP